MADYRNWLRISRRQIGFQLNWMQNHWNQAGEFQKYPTLRCLTEIIVYRNQNGPVSTKTNMSKAPKSFQGHNVYTCKIFHGDRGSKLTKVVRFWNGFNEILKVNFETSARTWWRNILTLGPQQPSQYKSMVFWYFFKLSQTLKIANKNLQAQKLS